MWHQWAELTPTVGVAKPVTKGPLASVRAQVLFREVVCEQLFQGFSTEKLRCRKLLDFYVVGNN